jgi:pyrroloquinoline quinone (PQQ) biosynthesis protein C
MVDFAVGCGANRDAVYNYRPSVPMLTAIHYWDNISRTQGWLPGFAAIGGLEFLNSGKLAQNNGEMPLNSRATFERLKLGSEHMHHWEAGEAADQDEAGHGQKTIDILVEHAATTELQQHVLGAFCESISVFRHLYDDIGRRAFGKDGKALASDRGN